MTQPKVVLDEDDIRRTLVRLAHRPRLIGDALEDRASGRVAERRESVNWVSRHAP